jgi:hypothetical protein
LRGPCLTFGFSSTTRSQQTSSVVSDQPAGGADASAAASPAQDANAVATANAAAQTRLQSGNFFERLGHFYAEDWSGTLPSGPTPVRRALDAPLDSAPFPNADWGYGGSPDIGAPDGNVYPLMTALKLQNSSTKVYGWVAPSFNVSTSGSNNFPVSYDIFPNRVELNQAVIYIEKLPDTVQTTLAIT